MNGGSDDVGPVGMLLAPRLCQEHGTRDRGQIMLSSR